jgi:hypothetical protein
VRFSGPAMTTDDEVRKGRNRRRTVVLDDPSQSTSILNVLGVLAAGALCGGAAFFLLCGPNLLGRSTVADAAPTLIAALLGCFIVTGLIAAPVVMRLTHRYVGPAHVMRRALHGMRLGDYGCRLQLRRGDFLKALAHEIEQHRSDLARRDVERTRLLTQLLQQLEAGDGEGARRRLAQLLHTDRDGALDRSA